MRIRFLLLLLLLAVCPARGERGAEIYRDHCASCHGDRGEGVAGEYDEALVGKKSIPSLAKYIHRTMPEDDEDAVIDEDARLVAEYIHGAFYSPEAQAKLEPVRRDFLRLTRHQHRRAITDLVQSFRWRPRMDGPHGLEGQYFNKEKMNDRKQALAKRTDSVIAFDFAKDHGVEKIDPKAHSIFWNGSLLPPTTGDYLFRIHSPNGFRLFLNEPDHRREALIDAWVSSGNTMRTEEGRTFLLAGQAVPLSLEYVSYQEEKSSIALEWKPPGGIWEPIPARYLFTSPSPKAVIVSTTFPPDDASLGYERGSSVSKAWKEAVARAAIEATAKIFEDLDQLANTKPGEPDRREKLKDFCARFATLAFGRPLTKHQQKRYLDDLFTADTDHETATKRSLMLILTSPYFLYPSLNKDEEGKSDGHTIASHLALALWDSIPDQALLQAAASGQLANEDEIRKHVHRMMDDPRTKSKLHRFFHHWLGLAEKEDLSKDPALFPGFDEAVIADLRASLDLFLDDVVWSESSDYRRLFTEERLYLNHRLARLYQTKLPDGSDFEFLLAPDQSRAGLLTHPYILTAFSYFQQTSPIHRGVYLGRNVLGRFLKPPPKAIEFKDGDFKPHLTMRQKVTEITRDESCMSCHAIINPVGFSLENFDAIGRFRTHEQDQPINPVSDYPTPDDRTIRITGPQDLAHLAIDSPQARRAFIKHLFHHLVQQPVSAYGFEEMDQLHQSFTDSQFHIRELIATIVCRTTRS
jgi:hypothetical protein